MIHETLTTLHQILLLVSLLVVLVLVHNVASVVACLAGRIRVERFVVFYGKPVMVFQTRLCPVAIGFLPFGGYIQFDIEEFARRPLLTRWLVVCSGPFVALISAGVFLRYDSAAVQFASAFTQIFRGTLAPFEHGVPLIRAFFAEATESVFVGYGILAAKSAAMNLLPIPSLAGGRILTEIPVGREKSAFGRMVSAIGFLIGAPVGVCWSVALVSYFRHL